VSNLGLLRRWLEALRTRRGHNRAIVALANKITRLAYRALRSEEAFDMRKAFAAAT
jgi:transposase